MNITDAKAIVYSGDRAVEVHITEFREGNSCAVEIAIDEYNANHENKATYRIESDRTHIRLNGNGMSIILLELVG